MEYIDQQTGVAQVNQVWYFEYKDNQHTLLREPLLLYPGAGTYICIWLSYLCLSACALWSYGARSASPISFHLADADFVNSVTYSIKRHYNKSQKIHQLPILQQIYHYKVNLTPNQLE